MCSDERLAKKVPLKTSVSGTYFSSFRKPFFMATLRKSSGIGEKNAENNGRSKRNKQGKTAKEVVNRHLSDKNDKITKEDFETLKIDLSLPKDRAGQPLPIKRGKARPKDADKDNTVTTPWDVISE